MQEVVLLKMGELVLKGLNRGRFEQALLKHARDVLRPYGNFTLVSRQSTITVTPVTPTSAAADKAVPDAAGALQASAFPEGAVAALQRVFGVAALTRALSCPKSLEAIFAVAPDYLAPALNNVKTFKVEARRADKNFPLTSPELMREVGGFLHDRFPHLTVDLKSPELVVYVEIRDTHAFLHAGVLPGAGGLPRGTSGRAVWLLSGGIDSPVAGYLMARRGLLPLPLHFYSYPYTSPEARDKVLTLAQKLVPHLGPMRVRMAPFTAVQEAIYRHCPEPLFTVIMRRFMMRVSERVALYDKAGALITGESLGQVASQTMEALGVTERVLTLPVLRPLIGMDKEDIVRHARNIGTLETSILPLEDCCTVFTPRHPRTRPVLAEIERAEEALDVEGLVTGVMKEMTIFYVTEDNWREGFKKT